jgi:flagellin
MAMVINSNIMSLNAQRNLTMSQGDQNQAMERLTSGKRINSAADDAAGLAISNRMTSQVRGLDQAVRNANDGISLIQTAEGALDESTNILQRMRELSIQSANGTYDDGNRSTLNAEVQQLISEIDRISETTKFNGLQILDGTLGQVDLQAGADAYETIALEIGATDSATLGGGQAGDLVGTAASSLFDSLSLLGSVTINGQAVTSTVLNAATNGDEFIAAINSNVSGVEAATFVEKEGTQVGTGIIASGATNATITVEQNDGTNFVFAVEGTGSVEELAAAINEKSEGVVTASVNDEGKIVLAAQDALAITTGAGFTAANSGLAAGTFNASLALTDTVGDKEITLTYGDTINDPAKLGVNTRTTANDITGSTVGTTTAITAGQVTINGVEIDETATAATVAANVTLLNKFSDETGVVASQTGSVITLNSVTGEEISIDYLDGSESTVAGILGGILETNNAESSGDTVSNIDISTAAGAQSAIGTIDAALEQINATRGDLGAVSNRLDFTVNNLSNVSENVAAARSRIEDADFASESAALSRAQVLQQAGTAMLAQANAAPQQVLSLLQ